MTYEMLANGAFSHDMAAKYHYPFDPGLADELAELFVGKKVIDFGAGVGKYVKHLDWRRGIEVSGLDAIPGVEQLTGGLVKHLDLTKPGLCDECDWALCLEVMEHIPSNLEEWPLTYLSTAKEGVVLSWAIPGQGGDGHVNERPNEYAMKTFIRIAENGMRKPFYHDQQTQARLRMAVSDLWWFANSLMVFRRI